eukprot:365077-Chlamydomonas_euryale.AAC.18
MSSSEACALRGRLNCVGSGVGVNLNGHSTFPCGFTLVAHTRYAPDWARHTQLAVCKTSFTAPDPTRQPLTPRPAADKVAQICADTRPARGFRPRGGAEPTASSGPQPQPHPHTVANRGSAAKRPRTLTGGVQGRLARRGAAGAQHGSALRGGRASRQARRQRVPGDGGMAGDWHGHGLVHATCVATTQHLRLQHAWSKA